MYPSSTLCRAQEAHQTSIAASATLTNVRDVALRAAAVWAKEALAAEKRESRKHLPADAAAGTADQPEREFSENPDRGFSNAGMAYG